MDSAKNAAAGPRVLQDRVPVIGQVAQLLHHAGTIGKVRTARVAIGHQVRLLDKHHTVQIGLRDVQARGDGGAAQRQTVGACDVVSD